MLLSVHNGDFCEWNIDKKRRWNSKLNLKLGSTLIYKKFSH